MAHIYPVFLPADITNPAVINFFASPSYRDNTADFFQQLHRFNRRVHDTRAEAPSAFLAIDPSQFGLIVTIYHTLVPQRADSPYTAPSSETLHQQYIFDKSITVKPNLPILVAFCVLEAMLIALTVYVFAQKQPNAQVTWEERVLQEYFLSDDQPESTNDGWPGHAAAVRSVLLNFHSFCLQLNRRHGGRDGFPIVDEYDVQDILHALLKLHFHDIRPEENTPSYAGSASRMDFLLAETGIVIEVKMARLGHADKQIGTELLIDVARYAVHQKCTHLICFVYDPSNSIVNARALQNDITENPGRLKVDVIFSPMH